MFNLGIACPCQIIVNFISKHIYTIWHSHWDPGACDKNICRHVLWWPPAPFYWVRSSCHQTWMSVWCSADMWKPDLETTAPVIQVISDTPPRNSKYIIIDYTTCTNWFSKKQIPIIFIMCVVFRTSYTVILRKQKSVFKNVSIHRRQSLKVWQWHYKWQMIQVATHCGKAGCGRRPFPRRTWTSTASGSHCSQSTLSTPSGSSSLAADCLCQTKPLHCDIRVLHTSPICTIKTQVNGWISASLKVMLIHHVL